MTIELIELLVCPALVFLAATTIARLIERQRDVLYGPYIQGRETDLAKLRDRFDAIMAAIGVNREYGCVAVKLSPVGIFASAIIG